MLLQYRFISSLPGLCTVSGIYFSIQFFQSWLPRKIDQISLSYSLQKDVICYEQNERCKNKFFSIIFLVINDKNIFHHKSYKQEVVIDRDYFEDNSCLVLEGVLYNFCHIFLVRLDIFENFLASVQQCKFDFPLVIASSSEALDRKCSSFSVHYFHQDTVLLLRSLQTNILSSILISRSKNVACVSQCSSFSSDSPGYIHLTLPVPIPDEEKKIKLNFYFHTSFWCLKRFYEGL